jgi:hypothetical protein
MKKFLLIIIFVLFMSTNVFPQSFEQTITIKTPDYKIIRLVSGNHSINMKGYYTNNIPGYPNLPVKKIRLAIHPDTDMNSIRLHYTKKNISNIGQYNIPESPTMATWDQKEQIVIHPIDISARNSFFPIDFVGLSNASQLRKWKIVSVTYSPFQYNPVSKMLRMIHSTKVTLRYQIDTHKPRSSKIMQDNVMDDRARSMIDNYKEVQQWYETGRALDSSDIFDYIIITTNKIVSKSSQLNNFIDNLTRRGFHPRIVTENDFAHLEAQAPNGRAEKMRKWLKDHYVEYGIEYVLLIGNPNPDNPKEDNDDVGDIPMKMCWPRKSQWDRHKDAPTDYFYADLTGNWDLNGDGFFGDYDRDRGYGGVDFLNEVYVGRIPVYNNDTKPLDNILKKTVHYSNEQNTQWRRKILMPMSFLDSKTDSAMLSEAMINNYLNSEGFDPWRQYMKGSVCSITNSIYEPEEELVYGATINNWKLNKYGIVWWSGHGNTKGAYIGIDNCYDSTFMASSYTTQLNDNYPAFVYQCSCTNGLPEESDNLQFSILSQGAIATYAASRVSWYMPKKWTIKAKYYCDNFSFGYYLGQNLAQENKDAAKALFDLKSDLGENNNGIWQGHAWMNLFVMNLLGDPSVKLFADIQDSPVIQLKQAKIISCQSAMLKGYINTNNIGLEYFFEYGETESFDNQTQKTFLDAETGIIDVNAQIDHLRPDQEYFYRLVAKYGEKTIRSEHKSFFTAVPVFHATLPDKVTIPINGKHEQTFEIKNTGCGNLLLKLRVIYNDLASEIRKNKIEQFVEKLNQKQGIVSNKSQSGSPKEKVEKRKSSNLKTSIAYTKLSNNSSRISVCILGSEPDTSAMEDIVQKISDSGFFNLVTYIDVSSITPNVSELQMFDALLIYSNYKFNDSYALGNNVADYIESGGGVVSMMFEIEKDGKWGLQGRFTQEKYLTIPPASPCARRPRLTMGKINYPDHPIMNNVNSFDGGKASIRPGTASVYSNVLRIADWADGKPLVTAKVLDCARRADLAFYPKSSDIYPDGWISNTDGHLLMANALVWVARHQSVDWLSIDTTNGNIPTKESKTITLNYHATDLMPGEYKASIEISHNAKNVLSPYIIPISMIVKTTDIVVTPSQVDVQMKQNAETTTELNIFNGSSKRLNWKIAKIQFVDALGQDLPQGNKYRWIDSNMENGPIYHWEDIVSTGQIITGIHDDNYAGPFQLRFPFKYYGESVQSIYICSNGFIAFGPVNKYYASYRNLKIPGNLVPSNMIAWCWDDMRPRESKVFFQSNPDQAIIQFNNYGQYNTNGTITAQMILKQNGEILIQYQQITNGFDIDSNTIGIANQDNSDGLLVSFNQHYLKDKLALKIDNVSSGVSVEPTSGTIDINKETTLQVRFFSYDLDVGEYTGAIKFKMDNQDMQFVDIPLNLTIQKNTDDQVKVHPVNQFFHNQFKTKRLDSMFFQWATQSKRSTILRNDIMEKTKDARLNTILKPSIIVTRIPEYNNRIVNLKGRVVNMKPSDCHIAVFINKNGWINKPDNEHPATIIQADGQWICDITTEHGDHQAKEIAIFLLTSDIKPVIMNGDYSFPESFENKTLHKLLLAR